MNNEQATVKAGERTQHTPGPWTYGNRRIGAADVFQVEDMSTNPICHVYHQDEANARLIAAAPELLYIANLIEDMWENDGEPQQEHRDLLRTAIAKAEGNE